MSWGATRTGTTVLDVCDHLRLTQERRTSILGWTRLTSSESLSGLGAVPAADGRWGLPLGCLLCSWQMSRNYQ